MDFVFEALSPPQSCLSPAEQMLLAVEADLAVVYDPPAGSDIFWSKNTSLADWSFCRLFQERLKIWYPVKEGDNLTTKLSPGPSY
jgi:hypothetical protein